MCVSDRMMWGETLLDNLLNFAATPRGLLLLQQTGAIHECVSHMFARFTKKLQVRLHLGVLFPAWSLISWCVATPSDGLLLTDCSCSTPTLVHSH